jgi:hypothetical protein
VVVEVVENEEHAAASQRASQASYTTACQEQK